VSDTSQANRQSAYAQELCERAKRWTDRDYWKHSWHWPVEDGRWADAAVERALGELGCGDEVEELAKRMNALAADIQERYQLAREMRDYLRLRDAGR